MKETKKPFPQFIDPHPRKHFYWVVLIVIAVAIAAGILINMEKFKTEEEINSLAPISCPKGMSCLH